MISTGEMFKWAVFFGLLRLLVWGAGEALGFHLSPAAAVDAGVGVFMGMWLYRGELNQRLRTAQRCTEALKKAEQERESQ